MPATRLLFIAGLGLAACASDTPPVDAELAPLTEPDIRARTEARVGAARERGFPDLSRVPSRAETVPTAGEVAAEQEMLLAEAEALFAFREAAGTPVDPGALERKATRLRAGVRRDRAAFEAQEPLDVPDAARPTSSGR